MHTIRRNAIVPYSPREMYDLVEGVDAYREFLPWCGGSAVLSRDGDVSRARVDIDFKGLKKSFVTRNRNQPGASIEMSLEKGPFRVLEGTWRFRPVGETGSQVSLELDFEFSGMVVDRLLGPVFNGIAGSMVDSFVKRAEAVYGRRRLEID